MVERRGWLRVGTGAACNVADAEPERHLGVPLHRAAHGVEVSVDVGERADYFAGTSRSALSQMKSSLL